MIDQSDEGWVVSSSGQPLIKKKWPRKSIQVVSNIVDVPGSNTPFALRRDWLFIDSFQHAPNIDAVLFFLKKILYSTDATRKKLEFLFSAHHCKNRQQSETVQQPDIALATMG